MYFDITTGLRLLRRSGIQVRGRGEGEKGRDQHTPDPDNEKITRTPQCLACCGARGGRTIQGHPLVASIPTSGFLFYGIPLDCTEHSFQYRV